MEVAVKSSANSVSVLRGRLLELGGLETGPTEDKTLVVFHTLDCLIAQLGIYKEVMKTCRDELFNAVYSSELTADAGLSMLSEDEQSCYVQRVPYFILVQRLKDSRNESLELLMTQNELLEQRLNETHLLYESTQTSVELLEKQKCEQEVVVDNLGGQINDLNQTIDGLQKELAISIKMSEDKELQAEYSIKCLKSDLKELTDNVKELLPYREAYDKLQLAFQQRSDVKQTANNGSKHASLVSDIEHSNRLEQQMLTVQNAIIEEYDRFLEDNKVLSLKFPVAGHRANKLRKNVDNENKGHRTKMMRDSFKLSIEALEAELSMLRQHRQLMESHLLELENGTTTVMRLPTNAQNNPSEDNQLTDEDNEFGLDPFSAHERILNKYAIMLYTSEDNGKSFTELKETSYCSSCGEQTVVCPHKYLRQDRILKLKPNTTHLKVARVKMQTTKASPPEHSDNTYRSLKSSTSFRSGDTDVLPLDGNADYLWTDFERRTDTKRLVTRQLTVERTVSLVQQFCEKLLDEDIEQIVTEQRTVHSVLDSLYNFMKMRYVELDASYAATHDLLTALLRHSHSHVFISLASQVFTGNADASSLRYVLLITDFTSACKLTQPNDFSKFAMAIYPFLNVVSLCTYCLGVMLTVDQEDDLEVLQLEYSAFSENKMSAVLVVDYITSLILKRKEPRIMEMESQLLCHPGKEIEVMTESEFFKAADEAIVTSCDRLESHLFRESAASYRQMKNSSVAECVPIRMLSQILSYLNLLGSTLQVKEEIGKHFR